MTTNKTNPISIILTEAQPQSNVIEIFNDIAGKKLYISAVGFTGSETIKFQQYVSANTGWVDIDISPTNLTTYTINEDTCVAIMEFPSIAKIKVISEGVLNPTNIKIDLSY